MHIAVNALYLRPGQVGGTERYLLELLPLLARLDAAHHWHVFLPREGKGALAGLGANVTRHILPVSGRHRVRRVLAEQTRLSRMAEREGCQVYWNPGASLPLSTRRPQVTTVHDCQSRALPGNFGPIERRAIEFHVRAAVRVGTLVLAPSRATRADLVRHYGADPARVRVIALAAAPRFSPAPEAADQGVLAGLGLAAGGYLLSVAACLPHKNLPLLFDAYALARQEDPALPPLAWTGPGQSREVERLARRAGLGGKVLALGWVPPEQMPALYRGARAVALASSFEGFGLAALESLACGTPLVSTPTAAVSEVVGEAALMTSSFDPQELAGALSRACREETLRERLAAQGPERAGRYSWKKAAEQTLAALAEAAYE